MNEYELISDLMKRLETRAESEGRLKAECAQKDRRIKELEEELKHAKEYIQMTGGAKVFQSFAADSKPTITNQ